MNSREVLDGIVAREAAKLDKLSEASKDVPLEGAQLEALEALARCAKALNVGPAKNEKNLKGGNVEDDLALAGS